MPASSYISQLRAKIGADLLLLPSVVALIHDEEGRLLLQRKASPEGWSLPAGGIEPGETPQEALEREVLEETGKTVLKADLLTVLGGKHYRYRYPNGHRVEYTVIVFKCTLKKAEAVPVDPETQELRYFSKSEMPILSQPYPMSLLFQ